MLFNNFFQYINEAIENIVEIKAPSNEYDKEVVTYFRNHLMLNKPKFYRISNVFSTSLIRLLNTKLDPAKVKKAHQNTIAFLYIKSMNIFCKVILEPNEKGDLEIKLKLALINDIFELSNEAKTWKSFNRLIDLASKKQFKGITPEQKEDFFKWFKLHKKDVKGRPAEDKQAILVISHTPKDEEGNDIEVSSGENTGTVKTSGVNVTGGGEQEEGKTPVKRGRPKKVVSTGDTGGVDDTPDVPKKRGRPKKVVQTFDDYVEEQPVVKKMTFNPHKPAKEQFKALFGEDFDYHVLKEDFDKDSVEEIFNALSDSIQVVPEFTSSIGIIGGKFHDWERAGHDIVTKLFDLNKELEAMEDDFKFTDEKLESMKNECEFEFKNFTMGDKVIAESTTIGRLVNHILVGGGDILKYPNTKTVDLEKVHTLLKKYKLDLDEKVQCDSNHNVKVESIDKNVYAFCLEYSLLQQETRIKTTKKNEYQSCLGTVLSEGLKGKQSDTAEAYCGSYTHASGVTKSRLVILKGKEAYENRQNYYGWHPIGGQFDGDTIVGDNLYDTVIHELGHALSTLLKIHPNYHWFTYKKDGDSKTFYTPRYWAQDPVKKLYALYTKLQLRMVNDYGAKTNPISRYAATNMEEMIAESWNHFTRYGKKSKPYVKLVISYLLEQAKENNIVLNINSKDCAVTEKELKAFDEYERVNVDRSRTIDSTRHAPVLPHSLRYPDDYIMYITEFNEKDELITKEVKYIDAISSIRMAIRHIKRFGLVSNIDDYPVLHHYNSGDWLELLLGFQEPKELRNLYRMSRFYIEDKDNKEKQETFIKRVNEIYVADRDKVETSTKEETYNSIFGRVKRSSEEVAKEKEQKLRKRIRSITNRLCKKWDTYAYYIPDIIDYNTVDRFGRLKPIKEVEAYLASLKDDYAIITQAKEEHLNDERYMKLQIKVIEKMDEIKEKYSGDADKLWFIEHCTASWYRQRARESYLYKDKARLLQQLLDLSPEEMYKIGCEKDYDDIV